MHIESRNAVVRNAVEAADRRRGGRAVNMSAQRAVALIEMEIGLPDSDAENLLAQYGRLIRSELGEKVYRDLYDRAVQNADNGGKE